LHDGKLGRGVVHSLQRADQIRGALLTIFGSSDPHVPQEARKRIMAALAAIPTLRHQMVLYQADHTFMRDDGDRWDPECADYAWSELINFFSQELT
jgi:carboxymethylenebutenolidase